jgi:predicted PurR-regulated permease PerM
MQTQIQSDLTRTVLVILIIAVLITGSLWTLLPFLSAVIWATTIVVATWPMLLNMQRRMGGHRGAATAFMTIVMLAVFIVPFALAVAVLVDAAVRSAELLRSVTSEGLPPAPAWLTGLPWVGERLAVRWQEFAALGPDGVTEALRPYARSTASWILSLSGSFGLVVIHFLLTIILVGILYASGEQASRGVLMFGKRIGKDRGERTVRLAGQALRGVALGVVITALVQSVIAGIGLWLAGVPRAGLLLAIIFVLCIAQLGPLPVLVPAIAWLYWTDNIFWGTVLVVFAVVVAVADNVLKPILIRRGVDLPMLLIIAGVIGGLIGFGIVGLFIGPVLLAITYTLLVSWVSDDESTRTAAAPSTNG